MSKPLELVNGVLTEVLSKTSSAGAADSGKTVALNGDGKIDPTMLESLDINTMEASENIGAGEFVNIFNDTTVKVRLADRSNNRPANGFVKEAILSGATGTGIFRGRNTGKSGMTIGAVQYLNTVGTTTETAPATAGLSQRLGVAISATEMTTEIAQAITQI